MRRMFLLFGLEQAVAVACAELELELELVNLLQLLDRPHSRIVEGHWGSTAPRPSLPNLHRKGRSEKPQWVMLWLLVGAGR